MNKRPNNPAIEQVRSIVFELAKEKIAAYKAKETKE